MVPRRRAWVLLRAALVWLTLSACNQSLFDSHGDDHAGGGGGDAGGTDVSVPTACPAPCIADAATAFDGTADGDDGHWRYVGDQRDHTWAEMTAFGGAMTGKADNRIERCADRPSADACAGVTHALLVTTSGAANASDPAVEYTITTARVVQLALHAHVSATGAEHRIRLYRNSREDVLFTAVTAPGATGAQVITVDAVPGDRFLVAIEPTTPQGGSVALQFFLADADMTFPSTCRLALGFSAPDITGATIDDLCGGSFTSLFNTTPTPPLLVAGPFREQGMAVHVEPGYYLHGSGPLGGGDTTIQFWIQNEPSNAGLAAVFSNVDEATFSGIAVEFDDTRGLELEAAVVGQTNPVAYTTQHITFPSPGKWHFVRIVHAGGTVTFCVDGARVTSLPLRNPAASPLAPTLGRNGPWSPSNDLIGAFDDLRVFSGTLPCDP